mgnify:CR=1 FL=1|jgi:hypothetical protein
MISNKRMIPYEKNIGAKISVSKKNLNCKVEFED